MDSTRKRARCRLKRGYVGFHVGMGEGKGLGFWGSRVLGLRFWGFGLFGLRVSLQLGIPRAIRWYVVGFPTEPDGTGRCIVA